MSTRWTTDRIGDQTGRTAVVTGPTAGGLGHHTALELARRGAHVVLAGRNPARTDATIAAIRAELPEASIGSVRLDLADLTQVREAASELVGLDRIDLLVNNAGVMLPGKGRTVDGFPIHLGTNHFGPFLLTALLLPTLAASGTEDRHSRVVSVSSALHRRAGHPPLADPTTVTPTNDVREYGRSKLANLLFTFELDKRLRAAGLPVDANAAHPGFAGTNLAVGGPFGGVTGLQSRIVDRTVRFIGQPAHQGAWPTLMAATDDVVSGSYVGPSRMREMQGPPTLVGASTLALNGDNQRRLWELSERAVAEEFSF